MNLEEYLTSYLKRKPKKSTKLKTIKQVSRRGRGFGRARNFRQKDYKNVKDEINMKILMLLDKMLGKDKEVEEKIYEKEEQEMKKPVLMLEDGKLKEDPEINIVEKEQLKIKLGNHLEDYKSKWEHIIDQQKDILTELDNVREGIMSEEALEQFQLENQRVKEEIVGLQFDLQKELNEAKDVRLYKEFIDFQNEVFTQAIPKFVEVDNRLVEEMKSNIELIEGTNEILEMREDEVRVLEEEVEEKRANLFDFAEKSKLALEQSKTRLETLGNDLKIEKQKTETLEDKIFGLEQQKQGMEQTLMGSEDIDVPERQFQQARQLLLERYAETQRQREEEERGRQERFREQSELQREFRDITEFFQ